MVPDYRGGVNYAKGFGALAGSSKAGFYYETTADAIYVSRFGKDWLFYSQNRAGRTVPLGEGNTLQFLINTNVVTDAQRQYWANTVEIGPRAAVQAVLAAEERLFFRRFSFRPVFDERFVYGEPAELQRREDWILVREDDEMKVRMLNVGRLGLLLVLAMTAAAATFQADGGSAATWKKILGSVGVEQASANPTIVVDGPAELAENHILILEGYSAAARGLGIVPQKDKVDVRQIVDTHAPKMQIIWEQPIEIAKAQLPEGFTVYATERWHGRGSTGRQTDGSRGCVVAGDRSGGKRNRAVSLSGAGAGGFRAGSTVGRDGLMGVFRFVIPNSGGCGLPGAALAGSGRWGAACGGLAQHGTGCGARRVHRALDSGVPPERDSGLCVG